VDGARGDPVAHHYDIVAVFVDCVVGGCSNAGICPGAAKNDGVDTPGFEHWEEDFAAFLVEVGELGEVQGLDGSRHFLVVNWCDFRHCRGCLRTVHKRRVVPIVDALWPVVSVLGGEQSISCDPGVVGPQNGQFLLPELTDEVLDGWDALLDVVLVTILHINHEKNIVPLVRVNAVTALHVDEVVGCEVVIAVVGYLAVVWIHLHVVHLFVLALVEIFPKATENFSASRIDFWRGVNL